MGATITVTGKAGPAIALTAIVITLVASFAIDCTTNILTYVLASSGFTNQVDISAATTITATKSGSTYTLTIS